MMVHPPTAASVNNVQETHEVSWLGSSESFFVASRTIIKGIYIAKDMMAPRAMKSIVDD